MSVFLLHTLAIVRVSRCLLTVMVPQKCNIIGELLFDVVGLGAAKERHK